MGQTFVEKDWFDKEMKEQELFVVGKINPDNHLEWEFFGVFDSKEKAESVCKDENYFIGSTTLNNRYIEDDPIPWPDAVYPNSEVR